MHFILKGLLLLRKKSLYSSRSLYIIFFFITSEISLCLGQKSTFLFFTLYPQTQPVPNPMSYYMHRSPWWFHRFETFSNHLIELVFPFFTFLGRRMCMFNGVMQILFQVPLWLEEKLKGFDGTFSCHY